MFKKQIKVFIFLIVLMLSACVKKDSKPLTIKTSNGDVHYMVEIADTDEKRTKGLMWREKMPSNSGMIFLFDESHPQPIAMWMKNTLIPLDMLFISKEGKIIGIAENTEPMSLKIISPTRQAASAVVEINAGEVKKHAVKIGDIVVF